MIFTDPATGHRYGYFDRWDGEVLHYFGEGQRGDMVFARGNRAILTHAETGKSLRLFQGSSGEVRYVGEFRVADPPFERVHARGSDDQDRIALVFRLAPAHGSTSLAMQTGAGFSTSYREANEDNRSAPARPAIGDPDAIDRASNAHSRLQNLLAHHMENQGATIHSPGAIDPQFDVAWEQDGQLTIAEVKSTTLTNETTQLRLGLGQVLEYQDIAERGGRAAKAILVVEREPAARKWVDLCARHGVTLLWPAALEALTQHAV
jgi:hypothetical protein